MLFLKHSTAATVKIGPFLDDSDGATAETGLTLAQADVRLSHNGGDFAQKHDASACTHDENGYYDCPLDATDTGTVGRLTVAVSASGALPVWHELVVLPANVYDSLVGGADTLEADVTQWKGAAPADLADADKVPASVQHEALGLSTFDPAAEEVTTDSASRQAAQADVSGLSTFDPASEDVHLADGDRDAIKGSPDSQTVKAAYEKADAVLTRVEALVGVAVVSDTAITGAGQDVARYRGDTAPIAFDLGRDITGASFAFTVKRRHRDAQADALVTKASTQGSEIEITDAPAGQFVVHLDAADTSGLLPDGRPATFVYDVQMTLDGVVETVATGDFALLPDVTTDA